MIDKFKLVEKLLLRRGRIILSNFMIDLINNGDKKTFGSYTLKDYQNLGWKDIEKIESVCGLHLEYHLSTEPKLIPGKFFSQQKRSLSTEGERGGEGENHIYTTISPQSWLSQFEYEHEIDKVTIPKYVYLVWVKNPEKLGRSVGDESVSKPNEVKVIKKIKTLRKSEKISMEELEYFRDIEIVEELNNLSNTQITEILNMELPQTTHRVLLD